MPPRVVVTGIGIVSPLGLNVQDTWKALVAGKSAADYISSFDPEPFETRFAAEVKAFDPIAYMGPKDARRTDRFIQFAIAASLQAQEQAKLVIDDSIAEEVGVIIGSGIGGLGTLSSQLQVLFEDQKPCLCTTERAVVAFSTDENGIVAGGERIEERSDHLIATLNQTHFASFAIG